MTVEDNKSEVILIREPSTELDTEELRGGRSLGGGCYFVDRETGEIRTVEDSIARYRERLEQSS